VAGKEKAWERRHQGILEGKGSQGGEAKAGQWGVETITRGVSPKGMARVEKEGSCDLWGRNRRGRTGRKPLKEKRRKARRKGKGLERKRIFVKKTPRHAPKRIDAKKSGGERGGRP